LRWLVAITFPLFALVPSAALAADPPKPEYGVLRRIVRETPTPQAPQLADLPSNPLATATPALGPGEPSPSPTPTIEIEAGDLPDFAARVDAVKGGVLGRQLLLEVPPRTQFDGTAYQASNCGPAAMAMVLEAFGLRVDTFKLRNYVNLLSGDRSPENGVALDSLAHVAAEAGLRPIGLHAPGGYRRWTVPEIREELRRGHPVITLVKLRELPDHLGSPSQVDHYVVVVGLDGEDLLVNDPASTAAGGHRRPVSPSDLERAWAASAVPGQALALSGGAGVPELALPDPVEEVGWLVAFVPADVEERRDAAVRQRVALAAAVLETVPPVCRLIGELAACDPSGAT
jgi:hypothetical protein